MRRLVNIKVAALVIAAVALLSFGRAGGAGSAKPVTHKVTIEGMQFQPDVVKAARGDSIVWTNKDLFPHTATASGSAFDSHEIKPGESWTYKAANAGEIAYVCSFHPTMKATLQIK